MIYLYICHLDHLLKICAKSIPKNGKNEICCIRKSHINKYGKNKKDNKYANISSYIAQEYFMKYTIHSTNCMTKMISSMWEMMTLK